MMGLHVQSVTLREIAGEKARFPRRLRDLICQSVKMVTIEELAGLLAKHEADSDNFDGRIEGHIRKLDSTLPIESNCRISRNTKFNSDLVIQSEEGLVCLEIEKGDNARFELDILKMQVYGSQQRKKRPGTQLYGAFIVPMDNKVNRNIAGNPHESSYDYLVRLGRLVAEIRPSVMEDVLIVGYAASLPAKPVRKKRMKAPGKPGKKDNVLKSSKGLLPDKRIEACLRDPIPELVSWLRRQLAEQHPELREKWNCKSRYLGYANGSGSDALYVYIQTRKKQLKIRVNLQPGADKAAELSAHGFQIERRDNFQADKGWLTGWVVPFNTDKRDIVLRYFMEALQ